MPCVVTEPCINCVYAKCQEVCPADAFHRGPNFMVINPFTCITCTICVVACPTGAILNDYELSLDQQHYIEVNEKLSNKWPVASTDAKALPEADYWANQTEKHHLLQS